MRHVRSRQETCTFVGSDGPLELRAAPRHSLTASLNVVATPPGFDPGRPYRLVGAHLDTIAVAPGAEDNASGIAVLLDSISVPVARRAAVAVFFVGCVVLSRQNLKTELYAGMHSAAFRGGIRGSC